MSAWEVRQYPEFSWSISRQRKIDQCPRLYYYAYYLSHNGWLDDASEDARLAYRLNKLTTLDAALGHEVDARARELETATRNSAPLASAEELEQRTRVALRELWRAAKAGRQAFEARAKSVTMFRSIYLGQDVAPEVERLNAKVGPCMNGLLSVDHWKRLQGTGQAGVVSVPDFASFEMRGLKVFAAPDLAYIRDGQLHVIDWKSGDRNPLDESQVLLQMLYVLETCPDAAGLELVGHREYVQEAVSLTVAPVANLREVTEEIVGSGVAKMRGLMRDHAVNEPLELEAFERHTSGLCKTCNFFPLCG